SPVAICSVRYCDDAVWIVACRKMDIYPLGNLSRCGVSPTPCWPTDQAKVPGEDAALPWSVSRLGGYVSCSFFGLAILSRKQSEPSPSDVQHCLHSRCLCSSGHAAQLLRGRRDRCRRLFYVRGRVLYVGRMGCRLQS